MMKVFRGLFVCVLLVLLCLPLGADDSGQFRFPREAVDFGVLLEQRLGVLGTGSDAQVDYVGTLLPWFSMFLNDDMEVYVSAGIGVQYPNENYRVFVPELLRTDFTWFLNNEMTLRAGRMQYSSPISFIAEGLFDGARFSLDNHLGTFSGGLWFTGLLHKNRANITMTAGDLDSHHNNNTYSAPNRLVAALDWEHPSLPLLDGFLRGSASFLCQFDLTGNDDTLHSQYLIGRLALPFNDFFFDAGISLGLFQHSDMGNSVGFAWELMAAWRHSLPIANQSFPSQLSFLMRYSSGRTSDSGGIGAFIPITTQSQGSVLQANIAGASMLSLSYVTRLHRTLSVSLSSSYFIRNDLGTFMGYPVDETNAGHFLGNEFFAQAFWRPFSDLLVSLGTGVFLPSMGNVAPNGDSLWRIELIAIVSLY